MDISVVPLTIDRWSQAEPLFRASRGVNGCWCMWPLRPRGRHRPDATANRAAFLAMVEAGESPGLIAVTEKRAAGWCAVGPRARYPQYPATVTSASVWAIPCLYVGAADDRGVVATALIEAALDVSRDNGAAAVEGPPPWWLPGDDKAVAWATDIFVANGFERVGPGARMPELRAVL